MSKITLGDLGKYDKAVAIDSVMAKVAEPAPVQAIQTAHTNHLASVWPFICGCLVGFILGAAFCRYEESAPLPDDDRQTVVVPDDRPIEDKKQDAAPKASHLVFITEVGEMTPATKKLYDKLVDYCDRNKMNLRRYDTDQKSSERYVEFAISKDVSPPFIVYVKDGKNIAVESAEKMEAKLR